MTSPLSPFDSAQAPTCPVAPGPGVQAVAVSDPGLIVVGLAIATGIVGVVVPVLPGALLAWAAIVVWALVVGGATAWAVLGVATLAMVAPRS